MKNYIMFVIFLVCSYNLPAQYYDTSLGLRAGTGLNASGKMFLSSSTAVEGIVGLYGFGGEYNGIGFTALYQIHNPIKNQDHQLAWYYGGAASLVLVESSSRIGFGGNVGIEYVFEDLPVNFAIDALPTIFLGDGEGNGFDTSFSAAVRYILQ